METFTIAFKGKTMIPKVIHYCWFGGKEKPEDVKRYIASWKQYCPDYEIKEWNESNFDVHENDYCQEAYEAKKWAFVTDYVRLKVLYEYGGIYMDTDVEVVKPLEPLLEYDAVSGYESETHIPTGTMGACKGNEWIGLLLHDYDNRHFLKKNGLFDMTTNVQVITKLTIKKYNLTLNGEEIHFGKNMVILPLDYLCAKHWDTREVNITPNTYTIHHFSGSWVSEEMKRYNSKIKFYYEHYTNIGIPSKLAFYLCRVKATYQMYGFKYLIKKIQNKM